MAQLVTICIDIGGELIKQFTSVSISQGISEHHLFRLVCPAQSIDGTKEKVFSTSKDMVGKTIHIKMGPEKDPDSFQFAGVITQVEAEHYSGYAGDIIISGASSTILLDDGPHCQSWKKQSLKNVAEEVLKAYPQNLLNPRVTPEKNESLSYIVQYKETAWQFLKRLSALYNEWFFYDGKKLILGSPKADKVKLFFEATLTTLIWPFSSGLLISE